MCEWKVSSITARALERLDTLIKIFIYLFQGLKKWWPCPCFEKVKSLNGSLSHFCFSPPFTPQHLLHIKIVWRHTFTFVSSAFNFFVTSYSHFFQALNKEGILLGVLTNLNREKWHFRIGWSDLFYTKIKQNAFFNKSWIADFPY